MIKNKRVFFRILYFSTATAVLCGILLLCALYLSSPPLPDVSWATSFTIQIFLPLIFSAGFLTFLIADVIFETRRNKYLQILLCIAVFILFYKRYSLLVPSLLSLTFVSAFFGRIRPAVWYERLFYGAIFLIWAICASWYRFRCANYACVFPPVPTAAGITFLFLSLRGIKYARVLTGAALVIPLGLIGYEKSAYLSFERECKNIAADYGEKVRPFHMPSSITFYGVNNIPLITTLPAEKAVQTAKAPYAAAMFEKRALKIEGCERLNESDKELLSRTARVILCKAPIQKIERNGITAEIRSVFPLTEKDEYITVKCSRPTSAPFLRRPAPFRAKYPERKFLRQNR